MAAPGEVSLLNFKTAVPQRGTLAKLQHRTANFVLHEIRSAIVVLGFTPLGLAFCVLTGGNKNSCVGA